MPRADLPVTVAGLIDAFPSGELSPSEAMEATIARVATNDDPAVWIGGVDADSARRAARDPVAGPLSGVPCAVKDNIDVGWRADDCGVSGILLRRGDVGHRRRPSRRRRRVGDRQDESRSVRHRSRRDPIALRHPDQSLRCDDRAGGSSSGSAVAVAAGLVPFALGTDTAGSGRIPAALGNIVGFKPTLGLVSTAGVVPACRSLDCVSVFALTARDAAIVFDAMDGPDPHDIYSRPSAARHQRRVAAPADVTIGVPDESVLARCDPELAEAFSRHTDELAALGVSLRRVDLGPFLEAGALLYDGRVARRTTRRRRTLHRGASRRCPSDHPIDHPRCRPLQRADRVRRRVPPSRAGDQGRRRVA